MTNTETESRATCKGCEGNDTLNRGGLCPYCQIDCDEGRRDQITGDLTPKGKQHYAPHRGPNVFDLSDIESLSDLRAVPDGTYAARVAEARQSQSPAGHNRIGIRWEALDGEFAGRTLCWDSLHLSARGLPRVKYLMEVLGMESEGRQRIEPDNFVNREAMVTIASVEREDPITGMRRLQNRVPFTGYSEIE